MLKVKYITNKIEESPVFDKESYLLDKIAIKLKILDMTRGLETTE